MIAIADNTSKSRTAPPMAPIESKEGRVSVKSQRLFYSRMMRKLERGVLVSWLREVEVRLGTGSERANDMWLAVELGHTINNLDACQQAMEMIEDEGLGGLVPKRS